MKIKCSSSESSSAFFWLNHSILGKAKDNKLLDINIVDYRKFSGNKHNQVDDYPFGGGQGWY